MSEYYCGACDKLVRQSVCPKCGADADRIQERKKLTRYERHQALADRGIDTWEDYRGEK